MRSNKKQKLLIKIKNYNRAIIVLSITMIALLCVIIPREYKLMINNNANRNIIDTFNNLDIVDGDAGNLGIDYDNQTQRIGKYSVIGIIKIESIGLEYPILNRTTEESLWMSITKLSGPQLNTNGNVTLTGHNARNGKLFGRLSQTKIGDIIEITTNEGSIKYEIYDILTVLPDQTDATLTKDYSVKELTLITCTMNGKRRLIAKAIEINQS